MILKVFIPEDLIDKRNSCPLYGEVAIEEKSVSYFIISGDNEDSNQFRKLGEIIIDKHNYNYSQKTDNIPISLAINNEKLFMYLTNLGIKDIENAIINLIIYTENTILCLNFSWSDNDNNDINFLRKLIEEKNILRKSKQHKYKLNAINGFRLFLETAYSIISKLKNIPILNRIVVNTALHDQINDWRKSMKNLDNKNNCNCHGQTWTLLFDVSAGMIIMLLFLFFIKPDEYLIETSQIVVIRLRMLLESLKGSPIGLKLNVQLNNFLLDCFTYHVNLWATFIITVSPIVRYLFIPMAILGFLGLSFQLAMLSDLIIFISLHAHCFYIYAAILYNIEKDGLSALWKVFLGKRKNVLKNRVESYDYMNRQLYLSTIFFTVLLFLLPTIIVYYTVFATLRVLIYLMCYSLMKIRRRILEFRVDLFFKWLFGSYYDVSSIEMEYLELIKAEHIRNRTTLSIFKLKVTKSSCKYVFIKSNNRTMESHTYLTLKQFLNGVLKGDMIDFSPMSHKCNST